MTKQANWATAAGVALVLGLVMMLALHFYGAPSFLTLNSHFNSGLPMHSMWGGMGWMMVLGPVSMLLFFGGVLALLVAVVRCFSK